MQSMPCSSSRIALRPLWKNPLYHSSIFLPTYLPSYLPNNLFMLLWCFRLFLVFSSKLTNLVVTILTKKKIQKKPEKSPQKQKKLKCQRNLKKNLLILQFLKSHKNFKKSKKISCFFSLKNQKIWKILFLIKKKCYPLSFDN